MFWPYLSYTLGALGHCLQQPHTFLCCYYYFEFNIRKPRLLSGQDAVGSKLLPSLHDQGMNVPVYTEVNKWCCWGSAKSYVQQFLSSKRPRLMSYPSHPSTLLFRKEASGPEMSSEGNTTATLSSLLTHPLILLEHLPGHLCWPEKNHQLFQVFPGTDICERASNDAAVNAEPECMHSNTQWKFLWLFLHGIHMFIFFIEIEGTMEYLLSLKTCLGARVGNYFSNVFVFHTYLLFSTRNNRYMQ